MFPQPPNQPPSAASSGFVRVSSLEAALANLNIEIQIEDLLKAVHDVEDEARRIRLSTTATAEATRSQRHAVLSARESTILLTTSLSNAMRVVALQPPESQTAGLKFTTVSRFVPDPAKPVHVDPLAKERRRRLLELTEQAFPDGKVEDPFSLI